MVILENQITVYPWLLNHIKKVIFIITAVWIAQSHLACKNISNYSHHTGFWVLITKLNALDIKRYADNDICLYVKYNPMIYNAWASESSLDSERGLCIWLSMRLKMKLHLKVWNNPLLQQDKLDERLQQSKYLLRFWGIQISSLCCVHTTWKKKKKNITTFCHQDHPILTFFVTTFLFDTSMVVYCRPF